MIAEEILDKVLADQMEADNYISFETAQEILNNFKALSPAKQEQPNYKNLLIKYVDHVSQQEGIDFLTKGYETNHLSVSEMKFIRDLSENSAALPSTK